MAWKDSIKVWPLGLASLAVLAVSVPCAADSISINGVLYEDVLVYRSSGVYYVKIPTEGRTISAPIAKVDESTLVVNDDPYYRDELKERYDEARVKGEMAKKGVDFGDPTDPAFEIRESDRRMDSSALFGGGGGGGGGKGLGISRALLQQPLAQQGWTFQGSGNSVTGTLPSSPQGSGTIQLTGPANNLTGITFSVTGQQQLVMLAVQQFAVMAMQLAPWSAMWLQQNQAALVAGRPIQKTQDGVSISIRGSESGQNVTVTMSIRSA